MWRVPSSAISSAALLVALVASAGAGNAASVEKSPGAPESAPIFVYGLQHNTSTRLTFMMLDRQPNLAIRQVPGGVEVRTDENAAYQLENIPALREVAGIDVRKEGTASIALVRLTGTYEVLEQHTGNKVRLDLVDTAQTPAPTPTPTAAPTPASGPKTVAQTPTAKPPSELDTLRTGLTEKLAQLKAPEPPPPVAPPPMLIPESPTASREPAQAAAALRQTCPPEFTMEGWKGDGQFPQRLQSLRALAAQSQEAPSAMAALAEFYLGNGLGGEALEIAREVKLDGVSAEDRRRLQRDADLARLLKGEPVGPTSVLLSAPTDCDRTDAPLWRVLSAATSGDLEEIRRDGEAAGYALQYIPEPLSNLFAFRIAEAAPEDLPVLRAMAAAVRNSDIGGPADAAGRYLLQSRMARARKDPIEEANFLERAAHDISVTGLKAKVRLAELRSTQDDGDGRNSESTLADAARVYRDTTFGKSAAAALSELRLRHADYTGALQVASDSAPGHGVQQADSHGATLAARVLRQLLVEKNAPGLPSPEQRLLIYWRYSGYATPGEKGDDIRVGAAQLMLDQGMPEAALDVMHQVTAQLPRATLLRATAEARAGDPELALALLKSVSPDDNPQSVVAEALVRLGKPTEAAHQLDGIKDLTGRARRAALLYEAKAWPDAVDAYADVLRDPALDKGARDEVADRYALALALSGKQPAEGLGAFTGLAEHVLGALREKAASPQSPVPAIRESLRRAGEIEALMPPASPAPPPAGG